MRLIQKITISIDGASETKLPPFKAYFWFYEFVRDSELSYDAATDTYIAGVCVLEELQRQLGKVASRKREAWFPPEAFMNKYTNNVARSKTSYNLPSEICQMVEQVDAIWRFMKTFGTVGVHVKIKFVDEP